MKKLQKAGILHPRDRRSPLHAAWQKNISAGMTAAKRKRRDVGLLTPQQVASQSCLPLALIKALIEAGELRSIGAGNRRFVFASEIKKLQDAA